MFRGSSDGGNGDEEYSDYFNTDDPQFGIAPDQTPAHLIVPTEDWYICGGKSFKSQSTNSRPGTNSDTNNLKTIDFSMSNLGTSLKGVLPNLVQNGTGLNDFHALKLEDEPAQKCVQEFSDIIRNYFQNDLSLPANNPRNSLKENPLAIGR